MGKCIICHQKDDTLIKCCNVCNYKLHTECLFNWINYSGNKKCFLCKNELKMTTKYELIYIILYFFILILSLLPFLIPLVMLNNIELYLFNPLFFEKFLNSIYLISTKFYLPIFYINTNKSMYDKYRDDIFKYIFLFCLINTFYILLFRFLCYCLPIFYFIKYNKNINIYLRKKIVKTRIIL